MREPHEQNCDVNSDLPEPPLPPVVSVVIPVRDDLNGLERCLAALSAQTFGKPFEILVIDNGSRRSPASTVASHANARLLEELTPGSYAARNHGISQAQGSIIAFTDADCIPAVDWIDSGVRAMESAGGNLRVAGRVETFAACPSNPSIAETYDLLHAFPQDIYVSTDSFSVTANLFAPATIFNTGVGFFDSRLQSSGDREWGQRATRCGIGLNYAPNAIVRHPARATVGALFTKTKRIQAGAVALRRSRGEAALLPDIYRLAFRPPLKQLLRDQRDLPKPTPVRRLLYGALLPSLYYYTLAARIRAVLTS